MCGRSRRAPCVLLLSFALLASPAAQAADTSRADREAHGRAAQLARDATARYRAGDFAAAGKLFLQAYEIGRRPSHLRNAANATEEAGLLEQAVLLWERCRLLPDQRKEDRLMAEAHIERIRRKRERHEVGHSEGVTREAAPAAPALEQPGAESEPAGVVPADAEAEPSSSSGSGGWIGIGAGVSLVIAGALVAGSASSVDLEAKLAMRDGAGRIVGIDRDAALEEQRSINVWRVTGVSLLSAGLVVTTIGLVWVVGSLARPTAGSHAAIGEEIGPARGVAAWVSDEGGGVAWSGRW